MPPRPRRTPAERARQVILNDVEIGPKYVRLSARDRATVDELLEGMQYRKARREILRLDELRRLQRREADRKRYGEGLIDGVVVDPSLMPLGGRVPIRSHETRGTFSLFLFDYQCIVTVDEADGSTDQVVTDNLGFDNWPTKEQIARRGIQNIALRVTENIPGSPKSPGIHGAKIARIALLVSRKRA